MNCREGSDAIATDAGGRPELTGRDHVMGPTGRKTRISLVIVVIGVLLFTAATAYMNWVKYVSLRSTWAYDLGFYHNSAFNHADGRSIHYLLVGAWFSRNDHEGPSVYRSAHFSPMVLIALPQLYRLRPRISTLMALQSLILGIGALPLFLFATGRTGNPRLGLAIALSYLLHPAILHLGFNDFRPLHLGISLALFALWFHASRKPLPFLVAALLMLSCRPEYLFLLAAFGVINWRLIPSRERNLRWLLAPALLAGLWAVLTSAYYLYFYGILWPPLTGWTAAERHASLVGNLLDRLPAFFRITLLPGAVGLLAPEAFLVALLFMSQAAEVNWPAFPHGHLQHLSPAIAVVFWAFAAGVVHLWPWLCRDRRREAGSQALLLIAAVASFAQFGWGAAQTYLIGGFPRYDEITQIDERLPKDATVMVPKHLMARFSHHTRVFTHRPLPLGARPLSRSEMGEIVAGLVSICDLIAIEARETEFSRLIAQTGRYEPVRNIGKFRFFVAAEGAPRPWDPDARLQEILHWDEMSEVKRRWTNSAVIPAISGLSR